MKWFKKVWNYITGKNKPQTRPDRDDNLGDSDATPEEPSGEGLLVYPKAVYYGEKQRTRGSYKDGYPKGAVIHFTAGRSRNKEEGGTRAKATNREMGKKSIDSSIRRGSFTYFVNDRDGTIHQAFNLKRWGYHAGSSSWSGLKGSVSDELVGIENQGAGRLKKVGTGKFKAYFTNAKKGDKYFYENEVRHAKKKDKNIQKGTYHKFTEAQEAGLVDLLIWLKRNNPEVFSFDFVLGHDEVSPERKNDPGASLSMNMPDFRAFLKREYKKRYGDS